MVLTVGLYYFKRSFDCEPNYDPNWYWCHCCIIITSKKKSFHSVAYGIRFVNWRYLNQQIQLYRKTQRFLFRLVLQLGWFRDNSSNKRPDCKKTHHLRWYLWLWEGHFSSRKPSQVVVHAMSDYHRAPIPSSSITNISFNPSSSWSLRMTHILRLNSMGPHG